MAHKSCSIPPPDTHTGTHTYVCIYMVCPPGKCFSTLSRRGANVGRAAAAGSGCEMYEELQSPSASTMFNFKCNFSQPADYPPPPPASSSFCRSPSPPMRTFYWQDIENYVNARVWLKRFMRFTCGARKQDQEKKVAGGGWGDEGGARLKQHSCLA